MQLIFYRVTQPSVKTFKEAAPDIVNFIESVKIHDVPVYLIGHNSRRFDAPFLDSEVRRNELIMPNWTFIDSLEAIKTFFNSIPPRDRPERFSLDFLRTFLNLEVSSHRVIGPWMIASCW